jgi:hypothetical protein
LLEQEVRRQFDVLAPHLKTPPEFNRKTLPDAYDLTVKDASNKEGMAQQDAFFRWLSRAINDRDLSSFEIAASPEVLVKNAKLVSGLRDELSNEIDGARAVYARRVPASEAEQAALLAVVDAHTKLLDTVDVDDYTPAQKVIDKAINDSLTRASNWMGIPVPAGCVLDQLGCDYLMVNKHTGEYHPLDVTIQGENRADRLVDCQSLNPQLTWSSVSADPSKNGKHMPSDRSRWAMSVPDEAAWEQAVSARMVSMKIDRRAAETLVESEARASTARAVVATLQTPSKLNLFEHPLPSLETNLDNNQRRTEAQKFVKQLYAVGLGGWARDIEQRLIHGYLRGRNQ